MMVSTAFLSIHYSSTLKSDFAEEKYRKMDRVKSLVNKGNNKIMIPKRFVEEQYVKRKVLDADQDYVKLHELISSDESNFVTFDDILFHDRFFNKITNEDYSLIISDFSYHAFLYEHFIEDGKFRLIDNMGKFYYSKPFGETLKACPVSKHSSQDKNVRNLNKLILRGLETETNFGNGRIFKFHNEILKWKEPVKSDFTIKLKALPGLFKLYLTGNIFATITLLIEFVLREKFFL